MTYFDFNSASEQTSFDLIPKGTVVRVRMTIKPGGHDDATQGWTGGFATRNINTGSVYLNCEFVVMEGEYARRKMWSLIGLHSPKGPEWANMGRTFSILRAASTQATAVLLHKTRAVSVVSPTWKALNSSAKSIGIRTRTARTRASLSQQSRQTIRTTRHSWAPHASRLHSHRRHHRPRTPMPRLPVARQCRVAPAGRSKEPPP
jgi:hypothetical protein